MTHHTTADFWACYKQLPEAVQRVADANYVLLRDNPQHPSLHFKRVDKYAHLRVSQRVSFIFIVRGRRKPMALSKMSASDRGIIFECLTAAARGPFFSEADLRILFGLERSEL